MPGMAVDGSWLLSDGTQAASASDAAFFSCVLLKNTQKIVPANATTTTTAMMVIHGRPSRRFTGGADGRLFLAFLPLAIMGKLSSSFASESGKCDCLGLQKDRLRSVRGEVVASV